MRYQRNHDGQVILTLSQQEISELEDLVSYMSALVDHDPVVLDMTDEQIDTWRNFLEKARRDQLE